MLANAKLVKSSGEVRRVPGEEISVDTVEGAIDLIWTSESSCIRPNVKRTKNVILPSLK